MAGVVLKLVLKPMVDTLNTNCSSIIFKIISGLKCFGIFKIDEYLLVFFIIIIMIIKYKVNDIMLIKKY